MTRETYVRALYFLKRGEKMTFRDFTPSDVDLFSAWLGKGYIKKWYSDPEDNSASRNTLLSAGFSLDESNHIFVLRRADVCK